MEIYSYNPLNDFDLKHNFVYLDRARWHEASSDQIDADKLLDLEIPFGLVDDEKTIRAFLNKYLGDDSKAQGSIQFDDEDAGFADVEEELDKIFEDLNLDERIVFVGDFCKFAKLYKGVCVRSVIGPSQGDVVVVIAVSDTMSEAELKVVIDNDFRDFLFFNDDGEDDDDHDDHDYD